jgi:hypothetical protein
LKPRDVKEVAYKEIQYINGVTEELSAYEVGFCSDKLVILPRNSGLLPTSL